MNIQLDYAVPDAVLADYVTLFYWFRADVPVFEDLERADHAQIRFRLTPGGGEYRFADGTVQSVADAHIIGPTTGAFQVKAAGPVEAFGAGITPTGWAALVGIDASAMINRAVNVSDLVGPQIGDAIDRLRAAPDLEAKKVCCEAILTSLLSGQRQKTLQFVRTVDAWLSDGDSPEIDALVAATGLSRRQVERKCRALYGAPPKLLARKYRALRAAVALVADDVSFDDAVGRGFYDQSHMIREIKHFTGMTPGQMKAEPGVLAQLTIANRYALGGHVHPIISDT
ncbi:MAG: helix-turn-helix transcriptional regulator [Sphingobium sp.]|nr:helix-turn-helix transcriptional regulator [Sphingobium sp.]